MIRKRREEFKYGFKNTLTLNNFTYDYVHNEYQKTYSHKQQKIIKEIKEKLKNAKEIYISKTNNWIRLDGIIYNGVNKKILGDLYESCRTF